MLKLLLMFLHFIMSFTKTKISVKGCHQVQSNFQLNYI